MDIHEQEMSDIAHDPTVDPELRMMAMEVLWERSRIKSQDTNDRDSHYQRSTFGSHIASGKAGSVLSYILIFLIGMVGYMILFF